MSDVAPEFPLAATALAPLRSKSEKAGSADFTPLWSCQATHDMIARWKESETVEDPKGKIKPSELYRDYKLWVELAGETNPMSQREFSQKLASLGFEPKKSSTLWIHGLRLKTVKERKAEEAAAKAEEAEENATEKPNDAAEETKIPAKALKFAAPPRRVGKGTKF